MCGGFWFGIGVVEEYFDFLFENVVMGVDVILGE